MNTQLTVMPAMDLREALNAALGEARAIEAKAEEHEKFSTETTKGMGLFSLGFFIMLMSILLSVLLKGAEMAVPFYLIPLIPIGAGCFLLVLGIVRWRKSIAKRKALKQGLDDELTQLIQTVTVLQAFPTDYCNSVALRYMVDLLDKGRADTWRECVDKWEEQVHRWTLEANSAEAARYAKSAASAASWAAIGAWGR